MEASITGETLVVNLPTTTGTLTGTFFVSSYEENGEHDGAAEFTATFMSSGAVTYVAGV
jgi:predicted secreted protein